MRFWLFLTLLSTSLCADISVSTQADKSSLTLDSTLTVEIRLSYPPETPPDIFPFLYNVSTAPNHSFDIVSSRIEANSIQFTLAPKHSGTLIFAPGILTFANKDFLVPPITVECAKVPSLNLPLAKLLPLYPEKRIDLSLQNRLALITKQQQASLKTQNESAFSRYSLAWNNLAYIAALIALSCLAIWAIIYYELLARALRPRPIEETSLQRAIKELQNPKADRWQALIELIRAGLKTKDTRPLHQLGLYELADYVESCPTLTDADKKLLVPSIKTLAPISYAGQAGTEATYKKLVSSLLDWARR